MAWNDRALSEALKQRIATLGIPGAAIAVHHQGAELAAAAGFANTEAQIEADQNTIFQIGSITKVFTATLLMKLVAEGRVELDAPASTYLPELRIAHSPAPAALTVRSLIDYTSGVEADNFADFGADASALARFVVSCADLIFVHEPGAMRSYCSTSFCIAGRIIELVTGRAFETALAEKLLVPAGLQRFAFYTHDVARYRVAVGHHRAAGGDAFAVTTPLRLPHALSAAGASLTMTAHDLLRFGLFHLYKGHPPGVTSALLPSSTFEDMLACRPALPGFNELLMGWASWPLQNGELIAASGATIDQNAILAFIPQTQFAISILANTAGGAERLFFDLGALLMQEIAGASISAHPAMTEIGGDVSAEDASPFVGQYRNSAHCSVTHDGRRLRLQIEATDSVGVRQLQSATLTRLAERDCFGFRPDGSTNAIGVVRFLCHPNERRAHHLAMSRRIYRRV